MPRATAEGNYAKCSAEGKIKIRMSVSLNKYVVPFEDKTNRQINLASNRDNVNQIHACPKCCKSEMSFVGPKYKGGLDYKAQ